MKRVLLTGGSGFVGAALARRLLRDGHAVHLLLRPGQDAWRVDPIRRDVTIHEADLTDAPSVAGAVAAARPQWVFHLAAFGAYSWQQDVMRILEVNCTGTIRLLEACREHGFEAFINTGSSSEYGVRDHAPVESEAVLPDNPYAVAKVAGTLYCRYAARKHHLPIATLRLYSAYGEWEEPNRLVPTLVARGLNGGLPPLVDPSVARDFVHVDDVCEAFVLAASKPRPEPGAVYNVATGVMTTIKDAVETARRVLKIPAEPQWGTMPNRSWDTAVWVGDSRKIRDVLGWAPTTSFADGLARTAAWMAADPARLAFYRSRQPS